MKKNDEAGKAPETIEADKMTDKQMETLLVGLAGTLQWKALKRLIAREMIVAENALCTIDPFKEPTEAARNQGKRMGMFTIESYVDSLAESVNNPKKDDDAPLY